MSSSPNRPGRLNLDNFLDRSRFSSQVLTSPRSIEACKMNGVEPHELLPKPMEAFAGGNVSQSFIQRRQQHAEERRRALLEKCRASRQELSDQGVGTPLSTPRQRASAGPSPARLSAERYKTTQQIRLEQLEEERKARAQAKTEALEEATRTAAENRNRFNDSVSQKSGQHWDQVCDTHDAALEMELEKGSARYQKFTERDQQRTNGAYSSRVARDEQWRQASVKRAEHQQGVAMTAEERFQLKQQRKREVCSDVERKQQAAEEYAFEKKDSFAQRGQQNDAARSQVAARAVETEEQKKTRRLVAQHEKEMRAQECRDALAELRAEQQSLYDKETEAYYRTVERGAELLEERKRRVAEQIREKELQNEEFRQGQQMEKWETIELKREAKSDKIEDVNRSRKSQDYRKQQKLQQHIIECDYGHVKTPRGTSNGY